MSALALLLAAAAAAASSPATPGAFERYSVLTAPGPELPNPKIMAGARRLLYGEHRVAKGEYYAGNIAKSYGTTLPALQATNNNEFVLMYPGMRMTVLNKDGLLYQVRRDGETLDEIAARHHRDAEARRRFKEAVVRANDLPGVALLAPYAFERGDRLLLPGIRVAFDTYRFPFEGFPRISSRFGYRFHPVKRVRKLHEGLDIAKPYGTPIYPARSGRVTQAGWHDGYGLIVVIQHSDGWTTRYGHMSKLYVQKGQMVQRGKTMIGRVGSTGISTGPHLHWELRDRNGRPVNPTAKIGKR